jgi:mRNA interferase HigB
MQLLQDERLWKLGRRDVSLGQWLAKWSATVEQSDWHSLADLRSAYPTADGVLLKSGNVVTVFNVKGNRFRLLTYVSYELQAVQVLEVLTHAEYDRQLWKARF